MHKRRDMGYLRTAKGVLAATAVTLAAMAVLTAAVWKADISDSMLVMLNQCIKIVAVALGTAMAVGRGGAGGFLTGAVIGTIYMALGYGMYAALGGPVEAGSLLGEWLVCAAAGALTGAVTANLPAKKHRKKGSSV